MVCTWPSLLINLMCHVLITVVCTWLSSLINVWGYVHIAIVSITINSIKLQVKYPPTVVIPDWVYSSIYKSCTQLMSCTQLYFVSAWVHSSIYEVMSLNEFIHHHVLLDNALTSCSCRLCTLLIHLNKRLLNNHTDFERLFCSYSTEIRLVGEHGCSSQLSQQIHWYSSFLCFTIF